MSLTEITQNKFVPKALAAAGLDHLFRLSYYQTSAPQGMHSWEYRGLNDCAPHYGIRLLDVYLSNVHYTEYATWDTDGTFVMSDKSYQHADFRTARDIGLFLHILEVCQPPGSSAYDRSHLLLVALSLINGTA